MALNTSTLHRIVQNVLADMLGLPCEPCSAVAQFADQRRVVGSICIFGRIKESLTVEAPLQTARVIAGTMFDLQPNDLTDEDVRDAIGEIANMICGNMKGLYGEGSRLSMPCVSTESTPTSVSPVNQVWITVDGDPLLIHWHELSSVVSETTV